MNRHRLVAVQLEAKQQERLEHPLETARQANHEDLLAPTSQSLLIEMQLEGLMLLILPMGIISFFVSQWR